MVAVTESGSALPDSTELVTNLDEYELKYAPNGYSYTPGQMGYVSAYKFFQEGGTRLYVGRVLGGAAASATGAVGTSWNATATSPGAWGNTLAVVVRTNAE